MPGNSVTYVDDLCAKCGAPEVVCSCPAFVRRYPPDCAGCGCRYVDHGEPGGACPEFEGGFSAEHRYRAATPDTALRDALIRLRATDPDATSVVPAVDRSRSYPDVDSALTPPSL